MNNQQEEIVKAMNEFSSKIDKIIVGKTKKWEGEADKIYNCDIYMFRHPGMGNSKQIVVADNNLAVLTITASYLEMLVRQGICDVKGLQKMVDMVKKSLKGEIKNGR